jgi:hypothetical protein
MTATNLRSIRNAKWSFIGVLVLTAFLALDFVLMERGGRGTGVFVVAGLACATTYFRYLKVKRQNGLDLIGDDNSLSFKHDA